LIRSDGVTLADAEKLNSSSKNRSSAVNCFFIIIDSPFRQPLYVTMENRKGAF
jgi:hypothetical protein